MNIFRNSEQKRRLECSSTLRHAQCPNNDFATPGPRWTVGSYGARLLDVLST